MESTPSPAADRRRRVWLEAAAALGAAVTLDVLLGGLGAPSALALPLGLAAVLVVALRGGFAPALAVAVLWVAADLTRTPDLRSLVERIVDALTVLGAATVGLAAERLLARVEHLQHVTAALRHPTPEIEATSEPRLRTDPLPRLLYRYARLLNVTDEAALYTGLVITLQEALPADAVAVFTLHDGQLRHAAGDALRAPPALPTFVAGQRAMPLDGSDDRDAALLRAGIGGPPAALIVVLGAGRPDRRARAVALLEAFVDWASAVVAHARTLQALPSDSRAESAERAEARGRAAARQFARTGRLTLVPTGGGEARSRARRDTVRESPAIPFGFDAVNEPSDPSTLPGVDPDARASDLEATERADPGEVDDLLDSGLLEEVSSESGDNASPRRAFEGPPSLLIGAAKASIQLEALEEQRDRRRRRSASLPGFGGETLIDPAPPQPGAETAPTPEPPPGITDRAAPRPTTDAPLGPPPSHKRAPTPSPQTQAAPPPTREADAIAPDVRRAIERMARRLATPQPTPLAERPRDSLHGVDAAELEGYAMPALGEEMVAADELPLIGRAAFGVGVAHEVGRSVAERRFATLLANLSDHLDHDG